MSMIGDAIEDAYEKGYKEGKQEGVEEFYKELVKLGSCSRGVILNAWDLAELKEKYNIK